MSNGLFGRMPAAPFGKLFVRDADKARALAKSGGDPAEAVVVVDADLVTLDQSAFTNGSTDFVVDGDLTVVAAPVVEEPVFELDAESEPVVEPVFEEVAVEEVAEVEVEAEVVSPFAAFEPAEGFVAPSKRGRPKKTQD